MKQEHAEELIASLEPLARRSVLKALLLVLATASGIASLYIPKTLPVKIALFGLVLALAIVLWLATLLSRALVDKRRIEAELSSAKNPDALNPQEECLLRRLSPYYQGIRLDQLKEMNIDPLAFQRLVDLSYISFDREVSLMIYVIEKGRAFMSKNRK